MPVAIAGSYVAGAAQITDGSVTPAKIAAGTQGYVPYYGAAGAFTSLAPDNGKFLKSQGAGANPIWATVGGGADGGTPYFFPLFSVDAVNQGSFQIAYQVLNIYAFYINNGSAANGDKFTMYALLSAGTYKFDICTQNGTNTGIIAIDIDGTDVATIDTYHAATTTYANVVSTTGIVVAATGLKAIGVRINGKNAGSSGYQMIINALSCSRTV